FFSSNFFILFPAEGASTVGGKRSDSCSWVFGRSTLPAFANAGRPSAPVTASIGRQVRFSTSSARSLCIGFVPPAKGNLRQISLPRTAAARFAWIFLSLGIFE